MNTQNNKGEEGGEHEVPGRHSLTTSAVRFITLAALLAAIHPAHTNSPPLQLTPPGTATHFTEYKMLL